uniref:cAMP-regulated phosphoprotein 19a n=1 Tax=Gouania willdenowi TaxID=441366 RepID=A0A8C5GHT3_GOUWI
MCILIQDMQSQLSNCFLSRKSDNMISQVKAEEAKQKPRHSNLGHRPGRSYFDCGDYNMAKAIKDKLPTAAPEKTEITVDHIPTPQDLPQRKPSLVTSKLAG